MSLKEVFEPYFRIGTAIPEMVLGRKEYKDEIINQYNSLTCENEMKPESVLDLKQCMADYENYKYEPALDFSDADKILSFAYENGIAMRGHTLVWHAQTPECFFHVKYDENEPYLERDEMLLRMEGYIKSVITYVQTKYPGLIYAWDVVNEAIVEEGLRESNWTKTVGDDFIIKAFEFARKYIGDGVLLFYNDYDTFLPWKRDLICDLVLEPLTQKGLIDGMGMQSHLTMYEPRLKEYEESLKRFGSLVKNIHVTELDIHNRDNSVQSQTALADRYKTLFYILLSNKKDGCANVNSVTFWGINDGWTWLDFFRKEKSYPLLFDECLNPKAAYWSVVSVPGLIEGDVADRLPHGQKFDFWECEEKISNELYVDAKTLADSESQDGSKEKPFATIQQAADIAKPGTKIWIHGGEYRECVHPRVGGNSPEEMIIYEAVPGEEVCIKASEVITDISKSEGWSFNRLEADSNYDGIKVWSAKIPASKYLGYNPFCAINMIHDRLFIEYAKTDMLTYLNRRGMVFCDGKPLTQVPLFYNLAESEGTYWVEANGMTVHFRLEGDVDPAGHLIEFTCREQCFAPEEPFLSYIKVKGITCAHAATGAPVPQRGAISAYRGHHWIIENCKIDWSNCVGIDVGNECWHHSIEEGRIYGHSIVRGCEIRDCGVCGIAGLFAKSMLIEDNFITGTGWQKMELSWEAAGVKLHNSTDALFRRNIFTETLRADHLWLDVANSNNRITGNLFLNGRQQREAIFIECSRDDVNLIDNNIFWNVEGRFDENNVPDEPGSTGWYKMKENDYINGYAIYGEGTDHLQVVNNFIGNMRSAGFYEKTVAFRFGENGMRGGTSVDAYICNNIFYDCKEAAIKFPTADNRSEGNVFCGMFNGGYLRILNPAPQINVDLQAWKEFLGFDKDGLEARFKVFVDTQNYTIKFEKTNSSVSGLPEWEKRFSMTDDPEDMHAVRPYIGINSDFYGNAYGYPRIPGPFAMVKNNEEINIDPRKIKGE